MNIIFTNHAQDRMRLRKMARSAIEKTLANPDRSHPGKKVDTVKFVRKLDGRQHEVVAKWLKEQNAWLVLSVWIRGEEDFHLFDWIITAPFKLLFRVIKNLFFRRQSI